MYEKNMAQDNKVPEQNKKCQKLKGWSAEGQRKQKEKKEIRVQNEWDRTFLMRKGCVGGWRGTNDSPKRKAGKRNCQ